VDIDSRLDYERNHFRIKKTPDLTLDYVCWFDGAAQSQGLLSRAGGIIKTIGNSTYRWTLNCGQGTNTREELLGLWASLTLAHRIKHHSVTCSGGLKDYYRLDQPQLQLKSY
jgi:hypothetical protein